MQIEVVGVSRQTYNDYNLFVHVLGSRDLFTHPVPSRAFAVPDSQSKGMSQVLFCKGQLSGLHVFFGKPLGRAFSLGLGIICVLRHFQ